jgi:hypothetical protein
LEKAMHGVRLLALALLAALVFGAGCLTEADRRQWGEALKDLRGDNMEMGSHSSSAP